MYLYVLHRCVAVLRPAQRGKLKPVNARPGQSPPAPGSPEQGFPLRQSDPSFRILTMWLHLQACLSLLRQFHPQEGQTGGMWGQGDGEQEEVCVGAEA